ncbi:hypothetical protein J1614_001029 [Plenodomus biglobosus]|nr:hypothetical protein J1614_001029 [Plenodomus biglobosus]
MPYIIRPPPTSAEANNSLYTYIIQTADVEISAMIHDLHAWGWLVSQHGADDQAYTTTLRAIDKAIKKRRRRTHMVYGDMIGEAAPPTLIEVWERHARRVGSGNIDGVEDDAVKGYDDDENKEEEQEKCEQASHAINTVSSHPDEKDPVDEWYDAEVARLSAIARGINQRWGMERRALIPEWVENEGKKEKRMVRVKSIVVERLDRTFAFEQRAVTDIPFSMRPMGLF